jgi:hypothetical protein
MKRLIRWAFYLFVFLVVLAVAGILLLDRIVKEAIESSLRAQTGLEAKIESVSVGLATPTFSLNGLTLYNSSEFGGGPMLKMPELHLEYDVDAIRAHTLRLKLVRLNISEIDAITDKKGKLNFQSLQEKNNALLAKSKTTNSLGGFTFGGIDTLNLTLGKLRVYTLGALDQEEDVTFNIQNQVFHNVKSEADLGGVGVILAARQAYASHSASGSNRAAQNLLNQLSGRK